MNRRHFMLSTSGAIVASVLPDMAMAACPSADALTGSLEDFKAMRPSKGIDRKSTRLNSSHRP